MGKKKFITLMMCLAMSCAGASVTTACGGSTSESSSSSDSSVQTPATIEYKVTFNTLGGSTVNAQTVEKGAKAVKPADPTRDGYTFVEWLLNGNPYNFDTAVTTNITLTASWVKNEPTKFAVTFVADDETFSTSDVIDGRKVMEPADVPTKEGYLFDGWMLDGVAYNFETPVTQAITLTASWVKAWTVSFDTGDGSPVESIVVKEGTAISAPETALEGYYLLDWTCGGATYDFTTPITSDVQLVAVWRAYAISVEFATDSKGFISVGETTTLVATADPVASEVVWTISDETIATIDNGVVTAVKGGEVTVTATIAGTTASDSKTIYVLGEGLYANQIGARMNGNTVTGQESWIAVESAENGDLTVTAKFQANETYSPAITMVNVYSKAYYENLIANGYTKFAFSLTVDGDVSDLYVFGKALSSFPCNNGVYAISIDVQHIVTNYETFYAIATSTTPAGQATSRPAKFITWTSPTGDWSSVRNYVFTISNAEFKAAPTVNVALAPDAKQTIRIGETTTVVATTDWNADYVVWSSSDEAIATVENGVVTAVLGGDVEITATVAGETASIIITVEVPNLDIALAENSKDMILIGEKTELIATSDWAGEDVVWSTSDETIATVDGGVVTAVNAGEVTITATLVGAVATKTIYIVGDGLYANQIGMRIFGNTVTGQEKWMSMATGESGEMVIIAKFQADATYSPSIVLRNMYSKAYYENLIANGYTNLTFYLAVEGDANDLYVFGKAISSFPSADGVYAVSIDLNHIINHYATMYTIATSKEQVGQASSMPAKLITWKSPAGDWSTVRDYVFTISGASFMKAPMLEMVGEDGVLVDSGEKLNVKTTWDERFVTWSSSDEATATVKNGVVTAVKSGEVTITAAIGSVSVSRTIYVAVGLNSDQIGMRIGGYQYHDKPAYFNMAVAENGDMTITAKFSDSEKYYPMLMLRNMYSKAYYEMLIANGYTKLAFNLTVAGENAANVSDLYVFGKALTSFPCKDGVYAISIEVQHIVTYYDNIYGIATTGGQAGQAGSLDKMFLAWKSPLTWAGSRNYVFTISDTAFVKGALQADEIGIRINGWNQSSVESYLKVAADVSGDLTITSKFQANATYSPALILKSLESKEFYEKMIADGYTKLVFNLAVDGDVTDLYVLGKELKSFPQENGVYTVTIAVKHFVQYYDTMNTIATSGDAVGQASSLAAKFIAWNSPANDWSSARDYVFTISNATYVKDVVAEA